MSSFASGFDGRLPLGVKPIVLSIDLMRGYFDSTSELNLPSSDFLTSASRVIEEARRSGVPVIHTRVVYGSDGMDGGLFIRKVGALRRLIGENPMNEIMPQVAPREGELVLVKQYASAFFGTTLASTLRAAGHDTVVIVGVTTSGCVRATAVDALQYGFVAAIVRDAVGDRAVAPHEANLFDLQAKYAEVVGEAQALDYLRGAR